MRFKTISVLTIFSLCFFSCGKKSEKANYVRPVKVATAQSQNEIRRDFSGIVDAVKFVNLSFRVGGQIIQLPVVEGQKVKQGQIIAQIDPRQIQLQYDAAKSTYETALAKLERNERLLAKQAVSVQEYEMTRASYEQAKSSYEAEQNNLAYTTLQAPFSGSIANRLVENYQVVNPGQAVVKLIDSKDLQIAFTVPDNYLSYLQNGGKSFSVEFELYPGIAFSAVLKEYIDASPEGSGIPVFLTINDPRFRTDEYDIKPGFSCNVNMNIKLNNSLSDLPYIPITAIFTPAEGTDKYVWLIDAATNTVHKQKVVTENLSGDDSVVIKQGLKSGQVVVTAGVTQLVEGEKVKILK